MSGWLLTQQARDNFQRTILVITYIYKIICTCVWVVLLIIYTVHLNVNHCCKDEICLAVNYESTFVTILPYNANLPISFHFILGNEYVARYSIFNAFNDRMLLGVGVVLLNKHILVPVFNWLACSYFRIAVISKCLYHWQCHRPYSYFILLQQLR